MFIPMSTNWTWGTGVRELRLLWDMTQVQLAEAAGVPQATISRIENGSRRVSDEVRIKIAGVFGIKPEKLFPYIEVVPDAEGVAS